MVLNKTILILEDNLLVLSKLLAQLEILEQDQPYSLSLMILTNSQQVVAFINGNPKAIFDVIVLDRDCKIHESFHILDFERWGSEKVISISSIPEYNEDAKKRGVTKVVLKDASHYDLFAQKVVGIVAEMIRS